MPIILNPDEYGQQQPVAASALQQMIAARVQGEQAGQLHPAAFGQPDPRQGWVDQAAENYARQRLAQAARAGLLHPSILMLNGDPAAQWRAVSAQIAQVAAQHGFRDAGAWLDRGAPGVRGQARHAGRGLVQHLADRQSGWVRA